MLLQDVKQNYQSDCLEVVLDQGEHKVHVWEVYKEGANPDGDTLLYTHDFGTLKVAKSVAKELGVPVVKQVRTQTTYFNVDGSKRGYGKEKHVGVL